MARASWGHLSLALVLGLTAAALLLPGGAPKQPGKVYVVQKLHWEYADRAVPYHEPDTPGAGLPQRAFADRARAEASCRARNLAARAEAGNPFPFGRRWGHSFPSLHDYTSTPTGEFFDWLAREGIEPPAGQREAWEAWRQKPESARQFEQRSYDAWWGWWNDAPGWTAERRAKVWEKLDRVRFYEVIEVDAE